MPIAWDEQAALPTETVREGRGWKQTTPHGNRGRFYEDTAPSDATWEATDTKFESMTTMLRRAWPTDFTGATKANQAKFVWEWAERLGQVRIQHDNLIKAGMSGEAEELAKQTLKVIRESSDVTLNQAADRGTAIHSYIEDRLAGVPVDWDRLADKGALTWVAAVERFLADIDPEPIMLETVAFNRDHVVAGQVDGLLRMRLRDQPEARWVVDWKSRTSKHDKRTKEPVQLGGYDIAMSEGYFFDDRGVRRQLDDEPTGLVVISFCPDGTWAPQPIDREAARTAYHAAVALSKVSATSYLFTERGAKASAPFDANKGVAEAIDRIPDDAPEKMALSVAWKQAGLPKPSQGELGADRYGEAMHLIHVHAAKFLPWPEHKPDLESATCPIERHAHLTTRLSNLPADLRTQVIGYAGPLRPLSSPLIDVRDADDWERLIVGAEDSYLCRMTEAHGLFDLIRDLPTEHREAVMELLPADMERWTADDVEVAAALWSLYVGGDIDADPEALGGKREAVAKAKVAAEKFGMTKPTKWDDIASNQILYAVTLAT